MVQRPAGPAADIAIEFGTRVRRARNNLATGGRPVSQERLAELAGLHRTYIGHVERGEVNIALYNIVRLAHALEIDPSELVYELTPVDPHDP